MKITELKCPSCGAKLKVDENNQNFADCVYCNNRFALEWENYSATVKETPPAPIPERIAYTPIRPATSSPTKSIRDTIISCAVVVVMIVSIIVYAYMRNAPQKHDSLNTSLPDISDIAQPPGYVDSVMQTGGLMADFVETVYGRTVEEVTEKELAQIQWLEMKSDIDYWQIGYSFDNPIENPQAELTWVKFSRDSYSNITLDGLSVFTGLKMISVAQTPRRGQLEGLALQGIHGYFDSLEQVAEIVEDPNEIRRIEILGNSVSLEGIERFPNLETLMIDSGVIEEERLLVNAASLKTLSLDLYDGSMDFSVLGIMPWLKSLTISCKNMKDISFVSKIENLQALHLEYGVFLTLEPLQGAANLTELSVVRCDELKEMSVVSTLTRLKKLKLELPYDCAQPDLSGLSEVEELYLEGFDSTEFLKGMDKLTVLTLDSCTPGSASDFTGLTQLKSLTCTSFGRAEHDYGFITALPALEELDLHGTVTYGDISGIFNMPTLKRLNINNMECEINFDRIAENTVLEELSINNVTLYENVSISGANGFYSINWDSVSLTEHLDVFAKLKGLKHLSICENELTSLDFASSLEALQDIDFSDNYVTDLTPLSLLKNLQQVVCTDNPISNYEVLGDSVNILR